MRLATDKGHVLVLALFALACGGGRSTIDLPSPVAHTSAAALDFGLSDCGGTGNPSTVTLTNDATALPLSWTATVEGPFALVGPTQGSLFSHESATLSVVPKVPTTADAAMPVAGTLKLVTNDPQHPELRIPLSALARGATLSFPASVDFGDIPLSASSPPVPIAFKNLGNAPVDVEVGIPSNPDFVRIAAGFHLDPGQEASPSYRFSPSQWSVETASANVVTKGPVCGAVPPLALTGHGTKGVVLTSPGKLDFGLVDCGTQAQAKTVLVQNTGNAPFDVSAALTGGTWFAVSPTTGTLQPGDSLTLTVAPNGVPAVSAVTPDLYADTLTISTTALGDLPHVVDLHETARGAILALTPTVQAGRTLIDGVKTLPFSITNTGNANVNVSATSTDGVFVVPSTPVPANGLPVSTTVESRPVPLMIGRDDTRTLAITASGPVCNVPTVPSGTVHGYDTAIDVDTRDAHTCVVGHSHRVYCQGYTSYIPPPIPQPTGGMDWVPGILADHAFGQEGALFTFAAGQVTFWRYGAPQPTVLPLPAYSELFPSADSMNFSVCLTAPSNPLHCFGVNNLGQLGDGTTNNYFTTLIVAMGGAPNVVAHSGNASFGCAVLATGGVLCTGGNYAGSLGNAAAPASTDILNPVSVDGVTDALRVSVAPYIGNAACVARTNGKVSCWGNGSPVAAEVGSFTDAVDVVSTGAAAGCALRAGGLVRCWGSGSIGDGLVSQPFHEADIAFAGPVQKLVRGAWGTVCAIESGGKVECFGTAPTPVMGFEGP